MICVTRYSKFYDNFCFVRLVCLLANMTLVEVSVTDNCNRLTQLPVSYWLSVLSLLWQPLSLSALSHVDIILIHYTSVVTSYFCLLHKHSIQIFYFRNATDDLQVAAAVITLLTVALLTSQHGVACAAALPLSTNVWLLWQSVLVS